MPILYLVMFVAYLIGAWMTVVAVFQAHGWLVGIATIAIWCVISFSCSKSLVKRFKARKQTN